MPKGELIYWKKMGGVTSARVAKRWLNGVSSG